MAQTLYIVVGPSSGWTDPTTAEIAAGQLAGGGAATWDNGGSAWTGSGQFADATGLAASTSYKAAACVYDSGTSTYSNVVVSGAWSTTGSSSAALAVTGGSGTFSGTASSPATATLDATGGAGTFSGSAGSGTSASIDVTGGSGTFAGSATAPALAALAVTGGAGTFSGAAYVPASVSLSATGNSGTFDGTASGGGLSAVGGGYADDSKPRGPRKKSTVTQRDDRDERRQEFEQLLARVKGQAADKALTAAQQAQVQPGAIPEPPRPPRMPDVRGVEPDVLRQWMPDLLATYRTEFAANFDRLARDIAAQQAAQRIATDDEDVALLAMML